MFIDANRDMFICQIMSPASVAPSERVDGIKIGVMVDSCVWSETNEMMAAISDQKLLVPRLSLSSRFVLSGRSLLIVPTDLNNRPFS